MASSTEVTTSPGLRTGPPSAAICGHNRPPPSPSSNRPPDSRSRVALALASAAGGRNVRLATSGTKRSRVVCPISVPISANVSRNAGEYGWSWIETKSKPPASAACREAGIYQFGFEQLAAWMGHRVSLSVGPLFCVIDGPTRGRRWSATAARYGLRQLAAEAGVRRRFAPHQLRHAHAVELAREGVAVNIIQRQLGHTDLGTTSTYLQGIDPSEIIDAVRSRRQPTISATAGLTL